MHTDWIFGFAGGLLIGTAAALFLLLNGRVMGASGLLARAIRPGPGWAEAAALIAGLVLVPWGLATVFGGAETHVQSAPWVIILAGLCVGFGTRLGNGCTSGHGVCGMSRLSMRSLVATLSFILAGVSAVLVFRHLLGII